jgi:hypothetical protein
MGAKVPDGNGASTFTYDVYSYQDLVFSSTQSFRIYTMPCLPYTALITFLTGGIVSINGLNTAQIPSPITSPGLGNYVVNSFNVQSGSIMPICYCKNPVSDTVFNSDPAGYNASQARIISQAWRLVYTGPAQAAQGVIAATPIPLVGDPQTLKSIGRINFFNAGGLLGTTPINCAATPVNVSPINLQSTQAKETVMCRPEACPRGIVRRNATANSWPFHDILDTSGLFVNLPPAGQLISVNDVTATISATFGAAIAGTANTVMGSYDFYDPSWQSTAIEATSITGSFRLEMYTCYEMIPAPTSMLYDVSTKSATNDTNLVQAIEHTAAAKPALMTSANASV